MDETLFCGCDSPAIQTVTGTGIISIDDVSFTQVHYLIKTDSSATLGNGFFQICIDDSTSVKKNTQKQIQNKDKIKFTGQIKRACPSVSADPIGDFIVIAQVDKI